MRTFGVVLSVVMFTAVAAGCSSYADDIATSGPETGTILVYGVVKKDGKPVVGAKVWLSLWPKSEVLAEMDEDESFTDYLPSKAVRTTPEGKYALRLDPDELSSRFFNGEFLNFDVEVRDGDAAGRWGSTGHLIDERFWRSDEGTRVADPLRRMDFDFGKKTVVMTDSFGEKETSEWTALY